MATELYLNNQNSNIERSNTGSFDVSDQTKANLSVLNNTDDSTSRFFEDKWNEKFLLYCRFKRAHNREPKNSETYQGFPLGTWVVNQRQAIKKGSLSQDRMQKLLAAGFIIDRHEAAWQERFELYKTFALEFGREVAESEIYHGFPLGKWAGKQRHAFKKGVLPEERLQKLLAVGFIFDPREATWQENYKLYIVFKSKYGQDPIQRESYQGVNLGAWVATQRISFKRGTLSEERRQKLLDAGFHF